ncbi:amidase domain-containing protein [Listeria booriae]|uniref:amidase domain-containing protein n=1 Tax=Listeria booriae TaxID=1552123 RepID=UPI001625E17A|nr:amidase domain-containing protein [Listeria booriae]MBC1803486.1 amidase domain-containing protein [Listeria booriae]MBC1892021.1 amidase domain-containing protein [Listeria booriae]
MKKFLIGIMLMFALMVLIPINTHASNSNTDMDITIREIEESLLTYFDDRGLDYEIGSAEMSNYLYKQLSEGADRELMELDNYEDVLAYATEYIYQETSGESIEDMQEATLRDIKDDVDKELHTQSVYFEKLSPMLLKASSYNRTAAVNYALKYALNNNKSYKYYGGSGGDCTNFVSQAIYAGGIRGTSTGYPLYKTWSSTLTQKGRSDSPAWINANEFRLYWQMKKSNVTAYSTKADLSKRANLGDVINYSNKKTGRSWHNCIVTGKSGSTLYISQHSIGRKNNNWNNISVDTKVNKLSLIKF